LATKRPANIKIMIPIFAVGCFLQLHSVGRSLIWAAAILCIIIAIRCNDALSSRAYLVRFARILGLMSYPSIFSMISLAWASFAL
jgi:hypothetical protein